jgi:hypothetical protein
MEHGSMPYLLSSGIPHLTCSLNNLKVKMKKHLKKENPFIWVKKSKLQLFSSQLLYQSQLVHCRGSGNQVLMLFLIYIFLNNLTYLAHCLL